VSIKRIAGLYCRCLDTIVFSDSMYNDIGVQETDGEILLQSLRGRFWLHLQETLATGRHSQGTAVI